ncbi:MAG: hypothetical protein Q8R98_19785 [Rubrivivax sp.]|nr:hypothetical protein [Rubrivivax sp.]MDP3222728.1 hypothetical protein [Rubrivivax sp.]MDP3614089.1 hypothetical protein [Rubrivivax sp.]
MRTLSVLHLLWSLLLASASAAALAAKECRYLAQHGTPVQTVSRQLSIGEVARPELSRLVLVRNDGPHDIRVTFDGAAPRQLARGQTEPSQGRFSQAVVLRSVECLAARSARSPHTQGSDAAALPAPLFGPPGPEPGPLRRAALPVP